MFVILEALHIFYVHFISKLLVESNSMNAVVLGCRSLWPILGDFTFTSMKSNLWFLGFKLSSSMLSGRLMLLQILCQN